MSGFCDGENLKVDRSDYIEFSISLLQSTRVRFCTEYFVIPDIENDTLPQNMVAKKRVI